MKQWYQSRTLWINALILLAFALDTLTHTVTLSADQLGWCTVAVAVVNMALRMTTSTGLIPPAGS